MTNPELLSPQDQNWGLTDLDRQLASVFKAYSRILEEYIKPNFSLDGLVSGQLGFEIEGVFYKGRGELRGTDEQGRVGWLIFERQGSQIDTPAHIVVVTSENFDLGPKSLKGLAYGWREEGTEEILSLLVEFQQGKIVRMKQETQEGVLFPIFNLPTHQKTQTFELNLSYLPGGKLVSCHTELRGRLYREGGQVRPIRVVAKQISGGEVLVVCPQQDSFFGDGEEGVIYWCYQLTTGVFCNVPVVFNPVVMVQNIANLIPATKLPQ